MPCPKPAAFLALVLIASSFTNAAEPPATWTQHCVRCHGENGKGETKMGRKLKIRDLTLEKTQRRLTDAEVTELIATGYKDNAGEERMPAFGEKLTLEERKALLVFIRSLKTGAR